MFYAFFHVVFEFPVRILVVRDSGNGVLPEMTSQQKTKVLYNSRTEQAFDLRVFCSSYFHEYFRPITKKTRSFWQCSSPLKCLPGSCVVVKVYLTVKYLLFPEISLSCSSQKSQNFYERPQLRFYRISVTAVPLIQCG